MSLQTPSLQLLANRLLSYFYELHNRFLEGFTNGHILGSKQIPELVHDNSNSFSVFSQNPNIHTFHHSDVNAEISVPDASDSCSNSDYGQASADISGDGSGAYDIDDYNNEHWAFQDQNDHVWYMIQWCASSGYKPL